MSTTAKMPSLSGDSSATTYGGVKAAAVFGTEAYDYEKRSCKMVITNKTTQKLDYVSGAEPSKLGTWWSGLPASVPAGAHSPILQLIDSSLDDSGVDSSVVYKVIIDGVETQITFHVKCTKADTDNVATVVTNRSDKVTASVNGQANYLQTNPLDVGFVITAA